MAAKGRFHLFTDYQGNWWLLSTPLQPQSLHRLAPQKGKTFWYNPRLIHTENPSQEQIDQLDPQKRQQRIGKSFLFFPGEMPDSLEVDPF